MRHLTADDRLDQQECRLSAAVVEAALAYRWAVRNTLNMADAQHSREVTLCALEAATDSLAAFLKETANE